MKNIILYKEKIDKIFEDNEQQQMVIVELYKLVLPDFDNIEKVKGWPQTNKETSEYLFDKFIEFDKKHHPEVVMPGGGWMNQGFGCRYECGKFMEVDMSEVKIIYKTIRQ